MTDNIDKRNKLDTSVNRRHLIYNIVILCMEVNFIQKHGWYFNIKKYELGLSNFNDIILEEYCPTEIIKLSLITRKNHNIERMRLMNQFDKVRELDKTFGKQSRQINKYIENLVREEFKYKKIGDAWISETILYNIIKTIYPKFTIKRHYKPKFLEGLEYDVFVEELSLAIEYQGIQHYKPIKHWGGKKGFVELKKRDKKKKKISKEQNINLICFDYDEPLDENYIKFKINNNLQQY